MIFKLKGDSNIQANFKDFSDKMMTDFMSKGDK